MTKKEAVGMSQALARGEGIVVPQPTTLLERAAKLNALSEVSQVALGMCLAEIKRTEAFRPEYEDFKSYYQLELGRSKGDVSKLLRVGEYMLESGFREEKLPEVGYTKLYASILSFADTKDPKYVVSAAQTNTLFELSDGGREERHAPHDCEWVPAKYCLLCSKVER